VPKIVYRFIVVGVILGALLFAGLYILERFRLSASLDDAKELRAINGKLVESNGILGNQLNEARATVDRIERDKRALDVQLGNVGSELANSKRESAILRKQLTDAQATIGELTSGSVETKGIIDELRQQNNEFGKVLEKYGLPPLDSEMVGDSGGNRGPN
jgi:chromosome segregation ATPase